MKYARLVIFLIERQFFLLYIASCNRTIFIVGLTLIASCTAASTSEADDFVWKPVSIKVENFAPRNLISNGSSISDFCPISQGQETAPASIPPEVARFGQIQLLNGVTGIAWSPNARYIATSEKFDQIIKIWSFPSLKLLHAIDKGEPGVLTESALSFSKDSKLLLTSSETPYSEDAGNSFSIINIKTGRISLNILGHESPPRHPADQPENVKWSIDGQYLYVKFSSDVWDEYAYDTTKWKIIDKISSPAMTMDAGPDLDEISTIYFSNLNNADLSTHQQSFAIWDEPSHRKVFDSIFLNEHQFPITSMSFDPR